MSTSQPNAIVPTIISVKGTNGAEIANGTTTLETRVTLEGKAEQSQRVEVRDGSSVKGAAVVDSTGNWTFTLNDLSVGLHIITAKAINGTGVTSPPRTFTVVPNK